jgi:hypothetical protein
LDPSKLVKLRLLEPFYVRNTFSVCVFLPGLEELSRLGENGIIDHSIPFLHSVNWRLGYFLVRVRVSLFLDAPSYLRLLDLVHDLPQILLKWDITL